MASTAFRSSLRLASKAPRVLVKSNKSLPPFLPQALNSRTTIRLSSSAATTTTTTTTTSSTMASKPFFDFVKARRTIYALNKTSPISDTQIESIVKEAILHVPSAFNSQTARLVLLLNKEHDTFWDHVASSIKAVTTPEQFEKSKSKLAGFKAGYGTILFYEDQPTIHGLEESFALYKDKFQQWSEHTSAMHQFVLWTALEAEGFGANLQHYNPLVDAKVRETWGVPESWDLKAQLVFGGRAAEAGEKAFKPVEGERLRVFGKEG
jgi:predicted oxidoreductase (fatty acid repression mutant protein)